VLADLSDGAIKFQSRPIAAESVGSKQEAVGSSE
jgi:hypothetical protein